CRLRVAKLGSPGNIGDGGSDLAHEDAVFPAVNPETGSLPPHLAAGVFVAIRGNDYRARNFGSDVILLRGSAPVVPDPRNSDRGKDLEGPSHLSIPHLRQRRIGSQAVYGGARHSRLRAEPGGRLPLQSDPARIGVQSGPSLLPLGETRKRNQISESRHV